MSGAENGPEQAENWVEQSVERAWQKTLEWMSRSGEQAESAAHSPLQHNISPTS